MFLSCCRKNLGVKNRVEDPNPNSVTLLQWAVTLIVTANKLNNKYRRHLLDKVLLAAPQYAHSLLHSQKHAVILINTPSSCR